MAVHTDKPREGDPKKRRKMALGRGLDSLIPMESPDEDKKKADYFLCDIDLIRPNRYQPRRRFSDEQLAELSDSIREQGILQPLVVRRDGLGYELVAGERRLRASKLAYLDKVPVVVKEITDEALLLLSIIENIQREDLNPLEEAEAYHLLMTEFGMTQEDTAIRVGKSRPAVANSLRLRHLPEPVKESILANRLSMGHARALLGAPSPAQQLAVWKAVMEKGLSVRQTEALIRKLKKEAEEASPAAPPEPPKDAHMASLTEELSRRFGTRVNILRKGKRGRVEIEFFSEEDLDRLLELLQRV